MHVSTCYCLQCIQKSVNAPTAFAGAWRVISAVVDKKTQEKFLIRKDGAKQTLEAVLGGAVRREAVWRHADLQLGGAADVVVSLRGHLRGSYPVVLIEESGSSCSTNYYSSSRAEALALRVINQWGFEPDQTFTSNAFIDFQNLS